MNERTTYVPLCSNCTNSTHAHANTVPPECNILMPSGYLSRRTNISDPLAKSLATSLTSLRMSAPFTTLIRPTTSRIPPVHVTTRSTLWQPGSDTILSRSGLLQGRNVRRLLALMANRPAFPSRIWPHLVKIRGIEDLGSQPTKHPSWSWLPARPRLLSSTSPKAPTSK